MDMKKFVMLMILALITLACVTLEGLIELPAQFIQINGLLMIVFTAAFISWALKIQVDDFGKN
jgi:hypothetical protein